MLTLPMLSHLLKSHMYALTALRKSFFLKNIWLAPLIPVQDPQLISSCNPVCGIDRLQLVADYIDN